MSMEVSPGGSGGEEPSWPVPAGGFVAEDDGEWLRRVSAEADGDGDEEWIAGEDVEAALLALAGSAAGSGQDPRGLAQGGLIDALGPGPELAAVAAGACDGAVLAGLSDDQVLGLAAAGRRLAGRAAWIQHAAIAEFAARRAEPDRKKATPLGFTPFAADELVPELIVTTSSAELQMAQARDAGRRLPANVALLKDGRISAFQLKIITDTTQCLSDAGAAEADTLIAAAAPDLTSGQLRAMCTKVVMMIDPAAAQQRKDKAAKEARVVRFQEYSGNAALCGRDLPPEEVLASSQHIDACARALRAAGIPGTLSQLRALAFLDLTQNRDPLHRIGTTSEDGGTDEPDDNGDGPGGGGDPRPGGPAGPAGAGATGKPPVRAVINLMVSAGTLLGWSPAPGEIAGFGLLDPQATRDLTEAASRHPGTRWCVTVVGPDGTADAHGCAPGQHPWTPGSRDGPATTDPAQVAELLRRLRVELAPIAKGTCDHRHYSDRYVISRKLKHLMQARAAKCTAPGCNRPAAEADADHTIPWPAGPSCECNLGAPCRYHHRNKQAPGWRLEQPEPGLMRWRNPSGRVHTTHPTKYMI
jgi:hypothetical protein